jgi:Domain of unknown function (DUF4129)
MPIRFKSLLCLLLVLFFVPVRRCGARAAQQNSALPAAGAGNVYPDASSFAAELHRLNDAIGKQNVTPEELAFVRRGLPSRWEVGTPENHYSVSTEPLRSLLGDPEMQKNSSKLAAKATEAAGWVRDLANQVEGYAGAQARNTAGARPALERILSNKEFGSVHGPTSWDLFRQRVSKWIQNLLLRLLGRVARHPMGATILFWVVIVGAVVWVAIALFRYWTRRAALEELQAPESVAFVRTWQEWIHGAREAATRGDFREAVHSAYWAGICYLEDSEVVRKDRTRTPREYMRLVSNSTQLAASGQKTREALSALTLVLEQVWYGRRAASNQDFTNAMQSVEALGCQLQ